MAEWVCADCGARHEENDPPCRQCAGEQFARLEDNTVERKDLEPIEISWACTDCGERHVKNSPPCNKCGGVQFEPVYRGAELTDTPSKKTQPADVEEQGLVSSAGDILFNKSLTRQLIDLELLFVTGFTWVGFLFSELIYHHWKLSNGQTAQYAHPSGMGEGPITKVAKILFWIQLALIGLGIVGLAVLAVT